MPDLISFADVPATGSPLGLIGDTGGTAFFTRTALVIQAGIPSANYVQGALPLPSSSVVLFEIECDFAVRIRFYATAADRDSDFGRSATIDPTAGTGILAEFVLSPNRPIKTGPPPILANDDDLPASRVYYTVENLSGLAAPLTVELQVASLE